MLHTAGDYLHVHVCCYRRYETLVIDLIGQLSSDVIGRREVIGYEALVI